MWRISVDLPTGGEATTTSPVRLEWAVLTPRGGGWIVQWFRTKAEAGPVLKASPESRLTKTTVIAIVRSP